MNAPIAVARSTRSSGMNTSPMASPNSSKPLGGRSAFDGDRVSPAAGSGSRRSSRCRTPARRPPGPGSRRVLPRRALGADERDRQVVHLALVRRPQRLPVRHGAQPMEPRDVVWMHDLDVRQMVAVVARAVRGEGCLDRVEGLTHRPVAQRVEVRLEPERVQLRHGVLQQLGDPRTRCRRCPSVRRSRPGTASASLR